MKGGKWGYINREGNIVVPTRFEEAGDFEDGMAQVRYKGAQVLIDKKGNIIRAGLSDMKKE